MAYDWETFGVTVAIDVVVCVVLLFIFDALRCTERFRRFYAPRYYVKTPGYRRPKPLPPRKRWFGWARCLVGYNENEILAVTGYDGLVYLNIFKFGMHLFGLLTLVICATVLPVNWTDDLVEDNKEKRRTARNEDDEVESTNFDKVTMANIQEESSRLWVHMIAVWFVTFFTLYLVWSYHKRAVDLRIEYLSSTKGGQSHAIFVTDIPGIKFGHPLDRLMNSFLFKFLPSTVRQKIQTTVEAMTNIATTGVGAIGAAGASALSQGKALVNTTATHARLLEETEDDAIETFVRPVAKEITDMDPSRWMQQRLEQNLSHEQAVEAMYSEVFPEGEVCCANIVMNTTSLEPLVAKLNNCVQRLEDILDHYATCIQREQECKQFTTRVIPMTEGKWATEKYGQVPQRVEHMEFLVSKIGQLKKQIQEEDGKAKSQVTASAFVVFNSRWSQVVGASAFFHHVETVWKGQAAPSPREIVWENLKWRSWERSMRRVTVWFCFFLLCCFFMIPVAAVQAMIEVDRLEDYAVIGDIVAFPIVKSLVQAVIPNLVLEIFLALLPGILAAMNHYQGFISRSTIDTEVTRKYFIFLIITIFLANFFARTFLGQLDLLVDDPAAVVDALGSSAPQSSNFFLYFIMTQAFISGASQMLQIAGLVLTAVLTFLAGTERAKNRIWQYKPLRFGHIVSRHTLTLFLGLVFSIVNPFILPVTFAYFALMMLYNRYSLLYIFSEDYESGGEVWNQVYEHVFVGLVFHHLMMLGILGLKKFPYAALIVPLPLFTIAFKFYLDYLFKRPLTLLSLRAARDLDALDKEREKRASFQEKEEATTWQDAYRHECFKIDWEQIDATCAEVPRVKEALEKPNQEAQLMVKDLNIRPAAKFYPVESHALTNEDLGESSNNNQVGSSEVHLLKE